MPMMTSFYLWAVRGGRCLGHHVFVRLLHQLLPDI